MLFIYELLGILLIFLIIGERVRFLFSQFWICWDGDGEVDGEQWSYCWSDVGVGAVDELEDDFWLWFEWFCVNSWSKSELFKVSIQDGCFKITLFWFFKLSVKILWEEGDADDEEVLVDKAVDVFALVFKMLAPFLNGKYLIWVLI